MRPLRMVKEPGANARTRGTRRRGVTDAVIVRRDDSISRKPSRRGPATHPPASPTPAPGVLTAAIAQRAGRPYQRTIRYADRHRDHPLMPALIVNMGRLNRNIGPRRLVTATRRIPATTTTPGRGRCPERPRPQARIRADMKSLLLTMEPDMSSWGLTIRRSRGTEHARMADLGAVCDGCA